MTGGKIPWGAHPNSIEGKADPETRQLLALARRKADADLRAVEAWGYDGCVSYPRGMLTAPIEERYEDAESSRV